MPLKLKIPLRCPICYATYYYQTGYDQHLENHKWHNTYLRPNMLVRLKDGGLIQVVSKKVIKECQFATGAGVQILTKNDILAFMADAPDMAPPTAPILNGDF